MVLTHAAYTTGKYTHGYVGLVYSRMEIGVPIFFVLSGFLLFGPWVRAAASGSPRRRCAATRGTGCGASCPPTSSPSCRRTLIYHFRTAGPNPGHTWMGLFRNLTLTQIYTDDYLFSYLHQGLTQMWSLAVEVAFYVALPLLAYLLLVVLCRRQWRPTCCLLAGCWCWRSSRPAWLVLVHTTDFLPDGARLWLPTYLVWFVGGMLLAVAAADGCARLRDGLRPAGGGLLSSSCPRRSPAQPTTSPAELREGLVKAVFYAVIATLVVAPLGAGRRGWYARLMASRPMVFLGEISYEIFLIHLVTMELVMVESCASPIYTGSMRWLFVVTMVVTVPLAWLLHRFTRVRT